jgi:beta-glucosidase
MRMLSRTIFDLAGQRLTFLAAVGVSLTIGLPIHDAHAQASAQTARSWEDTRLSPDQRADLLNRELTLDERIAMVHGPMALPFGNQPLPAEAILAAGYIPGVPRLGVPALYESDASLGVTNPLRLRPGDGATALPSGLALAATFNPALAYAGGAMIGSEARAKGFNVLLAGGVNLTRKPRNGRNFEYLGEDPLLAGTLAGESIRGIESNHIISTAKHFVLNDQETGRHFANELMDEPALRESDLLAFEIAIERGRPGSIMCAYNEVNGQYACGNEFLLDHVLKRDWAYPGWVMSDWGAVYGTAFAARGLDQESGQQLDQQVWFGAPLRAAVQSGELPMSRLSDMTRRILRSMFANGLFDYPLQRAEIDYAAHTEVARKEAAEGIVLLRNREGILPLARSGQHILVVGGYADLGTLSGGGSSQVFPPHTDSRTVIPLGGEGDMGPWRNMAFQSSPPLEAVRLRDPRATVQFDDGRYPSEAALLAKQADVVIVFANQWMAENEDAPDLTLPSGQDDLIRAVVAANAHTIVVLQTGGPVNMPWLDQTAAVVEAWYSGAGGADAIADVLFGLVNPSGRLPITFPASFDQVPTPQLAELELPEGQPFDVPHPEGAAAGYRWFAVHDQTPLFPFGFGLSYTRFGYSDLEVTGGKTLSVSFNVRNEGDRAGKDVPQVYLTSAAGTPVKRLIGFNKLELSPGADQRVTVVVDPRLLAHFDAGRQRWRVAPGEYHVEVGTSSANTRLTGSAAVHGSWLKP